MTSGKRALDKIYKRRDRYDIPDWQREKVWSETKKQNLIDTILKDWKLPKFYFLKTSDEPEEFEVVDGQQRLNAIFEFFGNELQLNPESEKKYKAKYYKDLDDNLSDKFDDFEIEFDIIENGSEAEVKEFFQRLQEGLPLTSSEKLNSIHSKLRDFIFEKPNHKFFKKVKVSDKRYGHFDIIAKVAAIEIDGLDTILRYNELKNIFFNQSNFSKKSQVAQNINNTLNFLLNTFTKQNLYLRNRSVIQSLITLALYLNKTKKMIGCEKQFKDFFENFMKELSHQVELGHDATDVDYLDFQRTINSNTRFGAKIRHKLLLKKLVIYNPEFIQLINNDLVIDGTIPQIIKDEAEKIIKLISIINEIYSAQNGEDLFKATNKTVKSQNNLANQIHNYNEYKDFIDQLYFLFCEAPGQRLVSNIPISFKDINLLRTDLQHDTDHGPTRKSRKRKRQISSTFKKYSNGPSPLTLSPDLFPMVQEKLLNAISLDLELLKNRKIINK